MSIRSKVIEYFQKYPDADKKEVAAKFGCSLPNTYTYQKIATKTYWPSVLRSPEPNPRDIQVGGDHYSSKTVQPWDAMESWMSKEEFSGFLRGNVIKYVSRYQDKGGLEDLQKANHYLSKLIEITSK
jgi:hypothetical protein